MGKKEEFEAKQSILKGMDEKDQLCRRKQLTRAGFSEFEIMQVSEPPEMLRPLVDEMLRQIPFVIPLRILSASWGETFLRDVRQKGGKYEKPNIYGFAVGAAISPLDKTSTIFSEFSPELIILPDGRISFTRSRVHYRGGLNRDISEFSINVQEQRKFILERIEMEFERNPALRKRHNIKGIFRKIFSK